MVSLQKSTHKISENDEFIQFHDLGGPLLIFAITLNNKKLPQLHSSRKHRPTAFKRYVRTYFLVFDVPMNKASTQREVTEFSSPHSQSAYPLVGADGLRSLPELLEALAHRNPHARIVRSERKRGSAAWTKREQPRSRISTPKVTHGTFLTFCNCHSTQKHTRGFPSQLHLDNCPGCPLMKRAIHELGGNTGETTQTSQKGEFFFQVFWFSSGFNLIKDQN